MNLSHEDKDWITDILVKQHEGRVNSSSELFNNMNKRMVSFESIISLNGGRISKLETTMTENNEAIKELQVALKPFTEGLLAGKLSYWFFLKVVAIFTAVGGAILIVRQFITIKI